MSSAKGEDTVSLMVCDAKKMRGLIDENTRGKKHTANEVLNAINRFEQKKTKNIDSHFFRVELIDINPENTDLLDFQQVKDYLSFVAPVPYQSSFYYRTDVYKHAQELGVKIDEYNITLNGEPIFKKYTTILKDSSTGTKYDDIFGVRFQDFYKNGELFAWMWVGVSRFQKSYPERSIKCAVYDCVKKTSRLVVRTHSRSYSKRTVATAILSARFSLPEQGFDPQFTARLFQ